MPEGGVGSARAAGCQYYTSIQVSEGGIGLARAAGSEYEGQTTTRGVPLHGEGGMDYAVWWGGCE
jgi:hypothetical protein